jgi:hypothetical protein
MVVIKIEWLEVHLEALKDSKNDKRRLKELTKGEIKYKG